MRYKKLICLLGLFTFFIFTGCGTQVYNLKFNSDNTLDFKIRITVDTTTYDLLSSYGININELNRNKISYGDEEIDSLDAVFQEQAAIYKQYGYDIINVVDTVEIGFEAHKTYTTIDEFNQEIKKMYDERIVGTNIEVIKEESSLKSTYKVYGSLEYILDDDVDLSDPAVKDNFSKVYNKSKLSASLSIDTPEKTTVIATDGANSGRTTVWQAMYDETDSSTEVHVISEFKNRSFYILIILGSLIGVIIAIIIGVKVAKKVKWNKRKREE